MYKAVVDFRDLLEDHEYKKGDAFPYEGDADPERVKNLMTPTSQRGALIEEVIEEVVSVEKKKSKKKED